MKAIVWISAFGVAGLVTATLLTRESTGEGWLYFGYFAGVASMLASGLVWYWLVRDRVPGIWRGVRIGSLVGLFSHPITWYMASVYSYFWANASLQSDEPLGPLSAISGSLVFSFWSVLLTGWITVPVAAGVGALFAWTFRKQHEPNEPLDERPRGSSI